MNQASTTLIQTDMSQLNSLIADLLQTFVFP